MGLGVPPGVLLVIGGSREGGSAGSVQVEDCQLFCQNSLVSRRAALSVAWRVQAGAQSVQAEARSFCWFSEMLRLEWN